ncbi:MAG TPA: hypothetical protein VFQ47_08150, partial [Nitrososphaera sp.]|nr:hypothetical protein [Nitrososphaera sp.]
MRPAPEEEEAMVCPKCGFKAKRIEEEDRKEVNTHATQDISLKVMDDEDSVEALPTTSIDCPQCKNGTAFWWMLQTRSADEATTQFY